MDEKDLKKIKIIVENAIENKTRNFITKNDAKNFTTKDDLKNFATKTDVENIVEEKQEKLAQMIAAGFENVQNQINGVKEEIIEIKNEITEVKSEISYIGSNFKGTKQNVEEMKEHFVYRHEFEDLESRVKLTETKLKIKSGK